MLKAVIVNISWWYVGKYQKKFSPIVIGVAGSIGKTGTKRVIAKTLEASKRVAWQDGNYNDIVTVPLIFFGQKEPSVYNPIGWMLVFFHMTLGLYTKTPAEIVVVELGTDSPGQIANFNDRIILDYAVVTAISYEHMQNFTDIHHVAQEELSIAKYSKKLYIGKQIEDDGFASKLPDYSTYGGSNKDRLSVSYSSQDVKVKSEDNSYSFKTKLAGPYQFDSLVISIELAEKLGISKEKIILALEAITPMPGRMQLLSGKDSSLLIDDTYNSSPEAVKAALDYLYARKQNHKIAVLGNMNEMGDISKQLHTEVGEYCDPVKLSEIITIGPDANEYLAEAATKVGCKVRTMNSPIEIGNYLAGLDLKDHAILFKGSQNKVFLEEAVKLVLNNPEDKSKLVRQSSYWLAEKSKQFEGIK